MITFRPTRRIVRWSVALSSAVPLAFALAVSASATTDTVGIHEADFTCQELHWADENVLEGTDCSPEHTGPIVDPFVVDGRMLGMPVTFRCDSGFGIVDTIRGFDCVQV
jgi:hypothetical protein